MNNTIETSMEGFGFIPEGSILHLITGQVEKFGKLGKAKLWIAKRYEKLALPVLFAGLMIVLWIQGKFNEPIPGLGVPLSLILNLFFLVVSMVVLTFLFGSFFFLKMKAGSAQGAIKFNIINEFTGSRENQMEYDMLIKRHTVLNPNLSRFLVFEKVLDKNGRPRFNISNDSIQEEDYSLEDIKNDPTISELMKELKVNANTKSTDIVNNLSNTDVQLDTNEIAVEYPEEQHNIIENNYNSQINDVIPANQSSIILAHRRNQEQFIPPTRQVFTEITPLNKFFPDKDKFLVHVIDFTGEYDFRGSKQPGILMSYPDENLENIFPQPTDVWATVGMTFGTIPMYCVDFVPIHFIGKVPLLYPTTTKKRNLSLANLGHYHEILPTREAIISAVNLVQLEVARPLLLILNHIRNQTDTYTASTEQLIRRGMGFAQRQLNNHKILHKPEQPTQSWQLILLGVLISMATVWWWYPFWRFIAQLIGVPIP